MIKIKPEFSPDEYLSLNQMLDAGVRANGLASVPNANHLLGIFNAALAVARAEEEAANNRPAPRKRAAAKAKEE